MDGRPGGVMTGHERELLRRRLQWLAGLRWYAAAGTLIAIEVGEYLLGIQLPAVFLIGLAVFMFAYNWYFKRWVRRPDFPPWIALAQVVLDVLVVTLALLMTGGFLNPFFTFYFFHIIIAWIILPFWQSVFITGLVTVCFAVQGLAPHEYDLKIMGEHPFHVVGAPFSFVLTSILTAYFVFIIMEDLRKRDRELRLARRQMELELNKLDNILRHLGAGMLVSDPRGAVSWVNDQIRAWFGNEGMDENRACYRAAHAAKAGAVRSGERQHYYREARLPTLADGVRDFEIIVTPVGGGREPGAQIVELVLDATEQKKAKEQWARAERLAAVGQLAAGVAHEINTPLGTINILAGESLDILRECGPETAAEAKAGLEDSLTVIREQTRRCKDIIQTLLDVSRKPESRPEPCALNDAVRAAAGLMRHKLNGIDVVLDMDPESPRAVLDRGGFERVLFNLLLNAADAVEGVSNPRIRVSTRRGGREARVGVRDNGPGIPGDALGRVFEPFFTTKEVGRGTGLGLYISYGIVREMGGSLEIKNLPRGGAEAVITLPLFEERNERIESPDLIG